MRSGPREEAKQTAKWPFPDASSFSRESATSRSQAGAPRTQGSRSLQQALALALLAYVHLSALTSSRPVVFFLEIPRSL